MSDTQISSKPSWAVPYSGWHSNASTLAAQLQELADAVKAMGDVPLSEVALDVTVQAQMSRPHRDRVATVDLLAQALGLQTELRRMDGDTFHYQAGDHTLPAAVFCEAVSAQEYNDGLAAMCSDELAGASA